MSAAKVKKVKAKDAPVDFGFGFTYKNGSKVDVRFWYYGRVVLCRIRCQTTNGKIWEREGWSRASTKDKFHTKIGIVKAAVSAGHALEPASRGFYMTRLSEAMKVAEEKGIITYVKEV